jgi:hypothetical protein
MKDINRVTLIEMAKKTNANTIHKNNAKTAEMLNRPNELLNDINRRDLPQSIYLVSWGKDKKHITYSKLRNIIRNIKPTVKTPTSVNENDLIETLNRIQK